MKKSKKRTVEKALTLSDTQVETLQENHLDKLESDPQYSIQVDPENKYSMPPSQKEFIRHYVQFKSIGTAAELAEIDHDTAKQYFVAWSTQQEIRRINRALYQRQFASKLVSLDEIGGYLTSLLTDENVPIGDQLKSQEKLKVATMLIELHKSKREALIDPGTIMSADLDVQIKSLSVTTIRQLLAQTKSKPISAIDEDDTLSMEEKAYLNTLPTQELLEIIDDSNKKEIQNDEQD